MTRASVEAYSRLDTGLGATALTGPTSRSSTSARAKTSTTSSSPIHDTHCDPGASGPPRPGGEERTEELEARPLRGLDDAGPHDHHTQTGLACRLRRSLPVGHDVGQEPRAAPALLGELLVPAIDAVVADGGRTDEDGTSVPGRGHGRHGRGQRVRRSDPAVPDQLLVAIAEAACDRRSGQVHDRVDTLERPRIGAVRLPVPLVNLARGPPHETDDPMTAGGEERAQRGTDEAGGTRHRHGQWSAERSTAMARWAARSAASCRCRYRNVCTRTDPAPVSPRRR